MSTEELYRALDAVMNKAVCDHCKNRGTCLNYVMKIYAPVDCENKNIEGRNKFYVDSVDAANVYKVWGEKDLSR